jgi:hypothetical protein
MKSILFSISFLLLFSQSTSAGIVVVPKEKSKTGRGPLEIWREKQQKKIKTDKIKQYQTPDIGPLYIPKYPRNTPPKINIRFRIDF